MKKIILVIGDSCEDIFVIGKVDRISPEAPVVILNPENETINGGMAKNVANNIASLVNEEYEIQLFTNDIPIIKTRYVDEKSGYILLRVDRDNKIDSLNLADCLNYITSAKDNLAAIVISDYNKGYLHKHDIPKIVDKAVEFSIPLFMDTKKIGMVLNKEAFCLKVNEKEYNNILQKSETSYESFEFLEGVANKIVTLGGDGARWIDDKNGGEWVFFPSEKINIRDVSGCGDSFLAGLVVRYCETKSLSESIKYANKVAANAAAQHGVVSVKKEDIHE